MTDESAATRKRRGAACRAGLAAMLGAENIGLSLALVAVVASFGALSPRFLPMATFNSVAFQLPELGLLTLAMLMPIISGGLNLAVTFTANICGLTLAWVLQGQWRRRCRARRLPPRLVRGIGVGTASGLVMGLVIAYTGAHPILVSLVDDDLPARARRVPDPRRRHLRRSRISSGRSAMARFSAFRSRC